MSFAGSPQGYFISERRCCCDVTLDVPESFATWSTDSVRCMELWIQFSLRSQRLKLSQWGWMDEHNYGKSHFFMGKSTIYLAIFNSYICNRMIKHGILGVLYILCTLILDKAIESKFDVSRRLKQPERHAGSRLSLRLSKMCWLPDLCKTSQES